MGSARAPPMMWSLRLLPHLILRSVVLSSASAPSDEVVKLLMNAGGGQTCTQDAHLHICVASKKRKKEKKILDLIGSSAIVLSFLIRFTHGLRSPSFRL